MNIGKGRTRQVLTGLLQRITHVLRKKTGSWLSGGNSSQANPLYRSAALWVIDCGSSGAAEREILAIFNPLYNAEHEGFQLAASPRHADILLVSGPLTRNMEAALLDTFRAMPDQRRVVTVGDALGGRGVFGDSYAVIPLPEEIAAARVMHIPGDPPSPADILDALRKIA